MSDTTDNLPLDTMPKLDREFDGDHADYFKMLERMMRGAHRRVVASDPADLAHLIALRDYLDIIVTSAGRGVHETFSWAEMAAELGVSRQAVAKAYGAK